ncbi:uncharacterized protein LOC108959267 [Eucalyptus grandis]|uniref:uncharacterized protein LOC108959267 n=1 Tax=Eucalyptus grandis TaxID=71139 RepID=UPI00192E94F2|nr:uncharacterized protein LOC108959267 [Eucalyptus grandis]
MEPPFLWEGTGRLKRRMTELDHRINGLLIRSLLDLFLYGVGLSQMSRLFITGFVWMPFSLSLIIFAIGCFYGYSRLRLLRAYSMEMERVAAVLDGRRRTLLELGRNRDAWEAEMAGILAVPAWTHQTQGAMNALLFVFLSVALIYPQYPFERYV